MLKQSLHSLALVLQRTANNKNNSLNIRQLAKEALDAVRQTAWDLDDKGMEEEATNRLIRTLIPTKLTPANEEKVQNT
jgi:signal transduction histidine kinase